MPATSITQQRLMGQAHGVRQLLDSNGSEGLDPKTLDKDYREEIVNLAKSMSAKDLEDFAKTKHKDLPKRILKKESVIENSTVATLGSVNGMGTPLFPADPGLQNDFGSQAVGSGDNPNAKTSKKKKKSQFKKYREFIQGGDLRAAFWVLAANKLI